ncbi:type II toxin-antitoxin system VapC family toxin [Zooshikella ganghwensis]|uniref:type II toxin-antitoxin system VapC family toxin n=1 Tax=Zooshikella ganghwensis TaxID=202772 RepID=UPI00197DCF81|nr:type II toxin-antitoxin system VapC family toxin [Zooshikella ganghwensis]
MKALFDTCILIDYLNGIEDAKHEFQLYEDKAISVITWMEVMVGTTEETEALTKQWLESAFMVIGVNQRVSEAAVTYRKEKRVKLPDAIIYSSSKCSDRLLVTRNTKDFKGDDPMVRVPYEIKPHIQ